MTTIRHGPVPDHWPADASAVTPAASELSVLLRTAARTLAWWQERQQRRRELKLLCAPEFAGYRRAMRSRER